MVAHTNSGTERRVLSTSVQGSRILGSASSRPATAASSVPTTDMANVSQVPKATLRSQGAERSSGKKLATKSAMARADSPDHSASSGMSSHWKLATAASAVASTKPALRQPQGEARAADGVSSARRSQPERASAPSTSSMKVARMVAASPPLSIFIAWSISCPRPPAPTKPITTEARMAHSQRYTV